MPPRFQPGQAHGGALAVIDTQRDGRPVCIVLPDRQKPEAAETLAQIFADTLNAINDKARKP